MNTEVQEKLKRQDYYCVREQRRDWVGQITRGLDHCERFSGGVEETESILFEERLKVACIYASISEEPYDDRVRRIIPFIRNDYIFKNLYL